MGNKESERQLLQQNVGFTRMESEGENEKENENEKIDDMSEEECFYYCKAFLERINEGKLAETYRDSYVFSKCYVPDKQIITSADHYSMFHKSLMKVQPEIFWKLKPYITEEMFAHYFCIFAFNTVNYSFLLKDLCYLTLHLTKESYDRVAGNNEFNFTLRRLKGLGGGCVSEVMKEKSSNEYVDDEWVKEMAAKYCESMSFE